jgi:hypothetical protein
MAVGAGNAGELMLAAPKLEPLGFLLVTGETHVRPRFGRLFPKAQEPPHAFAAASGDVGFSRTMAGFAALARRQLWGLTQEPAMWRGQQLLEAVRVAGLTDLRPDRGALRLERRTGRRLLARLCRRRA